MLNFASWAGGFSEPLRRSAVSFQKLTSITSKARPPTLHDFQAADKKIYQEIQETAEHIAVLAD